MPHPRDKSSGAPPSAKTRKRGPVGLAILGTEPGCGKTVLTTGLAATLQEEGFAARAVKPICLCGRQEAQAELSFISSISKTQLTYPIPNTAKTAGRCCQPFGRTTIDWGAGKEYPVRGEDFAFLLFRKRNCCVGE